MSSNGRCILVTRGEEDSQKWVAELAARGLRALAFPCIASETIRDAQTAEQLGAALDEADWLVLTSVRGVRGVAELVGARRAGKVSIAAVSETTAAAARQAFGHVDLTAPDGTAASLGEALAGVLRDSSRGAAFRVVAAGAETPRRDLEDALMPLGVQVQRIAVYRTVPAPLQEPREDLGARGIDTVFLASPSAVTGLLARAVVPGAAHIITIGPSTSAAARDAGLAVHGEAAARSLEAMIEAMS
ncbi:MAG: uroporphyrinogen-III synthase [Acidobacteriota bacterium]|jgi:uroporphyrinogen-III synthase